MARNELPKPAQGLTGVVLWIVAIVMWIVAPSIAYAPAGAFVIDTGIALASAGFAIFFVSSLRSYLLALLLAVIAIILFAVGDFAQVTPLLYFLRIFVPFIALLMPLNKQLNGIRIFA
ncbi:hypothetical protein [Compostimonas suwonensis]|uniref:Uncharacterized protein n=1 Tax=Compostimonas suwonensis TaxID=1048394 RepID=A0A2M9BCA8_9MICO|nr:hypothetical protein [Compostimonas suwonensis]PJJ55577.1 hypothetical protein CLV54_2924 [Compostimonas suwonensis]